MRPRTADRPESWHDTKNDECDDDDEQDEEMGVGISGSERLIYCSYYLCGGFYWCTEVPAWTRIVVASVVTLLPLWYALVEFPLYLRSAHSTGAAAAAAASFNLPELLNVLWSVCDTTVFTIFPFVTYVFRRPFDAVFNYLRRDYDRRRSRKRPSPSPTHSFTTIYGGKVSDRHAEMAMRRDAMYDDGARRFVPMSDAALCVGSLVCLTAILLYCVVFVVVNLVRVPWRNGGTTVSFGHVQRHILGVYYATKISSPEGYAAVLMIECTLAACIGLVSSAQFSFFYLVVKRLQRVAFRHLRKVRRLSLVLSDLYETRHLAGGGHNRGRQPTAAWYAIADSFERDLKRPMKKLIELVQLIHTYTPLLNTIMSFVVFSSYWTLFSATYFFIQDKYVMEDETAFMITQSMLYLATAVILGMSCVAAQSLHQIVEQISYEFYNTPWYALPCAGRARTTHRAFCALSGATKVRLRLFKFYPLNVAAFLRTLNLVYSFGNLLNKSSAAK